LSGYRAGTQKHFGSEPQSGYNGCLNPKEFELAALKSERIQVLALKPSEWVTNSGSDSESKPRIYES